MALKWTAFLIIESSKYCWNEALRQIYSRRYSIPSTVIDRFSNKTSHLFNKLIFNFINKLTNEKKELLVSIHVSYAEIWNKTVPD